MEISAVPPNAAQATADAAIPKSTVTAADDLIIGTGAGAVTNLAFAASRIPLKGAAGGLIAATAAQLDTFMVGSSTGASSAAIAELQLGHFLVIRFNVAGTGDRTWTCPAGRAYHVAFIIGQSIGGASTYRFFKNTTATLITATNITFGAAGTVSLGSSVVFTLANCDLAAGDTANADALAGGGSGTCYLFLECTL